MTSRERVKMALNHRQPDRVPIDLGATAVTGMHVSAVYHVRQALGLDAPGTPVKVIEPYQMLGEIAPDLRTLLGIDTVGVMGRTNMFGFANAGWKEWQLYDTPLLVPAGFNTVPNADGSLFLYPEGDTSVPPSGVMPAGGFFFDSLTRQPPIDDDHLNVEDNLEEFGAISDADLAHFRREVDAAYHGTEQAVVATFGGTAFGDIALVPAAWLKHPKGIRAVEEWYVSSLIRTDYVLEVFDRQCEIGIANLEKIHQVVGDRVAAVFVSGTDFGTQRGPFIAPETYRTLYQPFNRRVNDWIHQHTTWKTFLHTCGSVVALMDDFIAAGFDNLNPVQCSAEGMEPEGLKARFGDRVTFWGGGVNTQLTLPFGTPDEVRAEVRERLRIFAPGGGFVFNPIHNVQAGTPVENILAMFEVLKEAAG